MPGVSNLFLSSELDGNIVKNLKTTNDPSNINVVTEVDIEVLQDIQMAESQKKRSTFEIVSQFLSPYNISDKDEFPSLSQFIELGKKTEKIEY